MELRKLTSFFLDSNTFVLSNGGECLIIDAGAELDEIKEVVGKRKVVGLLLTHGHYDHAYYALDVANFFDCTIYAHKNAEVTLSDPKKNYGETFAITDFSRFKFFSNEEKLKIGSFDVSAISLPGHSKCSCGYIVGDIFFAGDTLFSQGVGRTDLFGGSKGELLNSLKKIQTLEFTIVASGHGANSTKQLEQRNLQIFIRFLSRV